MTLQEPEVRQLEMLARHEEAVGELYHAYQERFPEYSEFWHRLAEEERGHAGWIRRLLDLADRNEITFDEDRFNLKAIESSIEYIEHWRDEARNRPMEIINALAIALDIENALIEKGYYRVFESDNIELRVVFDGLVEASKKHRQRIIDLMTQVKNQAPEAPIG